MRSAPFHYQKTVAGFVPMSAAAREFHTKTRLGQTIILNGRRPRNPKHHRKLFALLGLVVDNTELFANTDDALIALKAVLGRGHWDTPKWASKAIFYPESIAFDAMSQDEFEPFYEAAVAAVIRWWLPVEKDEIHAAVQEFAA